MVSTTLEESLPLPFGNLRRIYDIKLRIGAMNTNTFLFQLVVKVAIDTL